jgi:hypothetical protein
LETSFDDLLTEAVIKRIEAEGEGVEEPGA